MAEAEILLFEPLPKEEVIKAVTRKGPSRIPLVLAHWWGEGLADQYGKALEQFNRYPEDAGLVLDPLFLDPKTLNLPWWSVAAGRAHDNNPVIDDWSRLDDIIEHMPDPERDPGFDKLVEKAELFRRRGIYVLYGFWRLFFERPWLYRGMENLMADYYLDPEPVHRFHSALCDCYLKYLGRAVRDLKPDGFFTSDDLGSQRASMMSPDSFRAMIKPYYKRIGAFLAEHGLHWWLHSCGNNTLLMDDLIDSGVGIFHPVQKGTMDEKSVASDFGGRISFLAGIDVQHTLQEKNPDGVREEVRFLIDTFDRPEGGLCLAAGNGIVRGTPINNISAFLDEALRYGAEHRAALN
jgi:uroporphyrinogen decarboxylase